MDTPLSGWHERVWAWFTSHARRPHALGWLALIAFADAIFFPIAPEVFLVALMLAHARGARVYLFVAAVASAIGAAAAYFIAVFVFAQFGAPILAFYHLEPAFAVAQAFIGGHVFFAMAAASFTPIPDKVYIYAAGFLGVGFMPFFFGYVLGRTVRMAIFVYLTERYGARALDIFRRYLLWCTALLVILGTIYVMVRLHLFGL